MAMNTIVKLFLAICTSVALNYISVIGLQFYNWGYAFGIPNIITYANLIALLCALAVWTAGSRKKPKTEAAIVNGSSGATFAKVPSNGEDLQGKTLYRCWNPKCRGVFEKPAILEDYIENAATEVCPHCLAPVKPGPQSPAAAPCKEPETLEVI